MSDNSFESDRSQRPPGGNQLADEALRLVGSAQEWLRDWTARTTDTAGEAAGGTEAGAPGEGHSIGGGDCQWCPLCQFVAVLRGDRPELTERVTEAGGAVVAALRAFVAAATTTAGTTSTAASNGSWPSDGPESGEAADSAARRGGGGQHRHAAPESPRVQRIDLTEPS